jgi:hypothetical protein
MKLEAKQRLIETRHLEAAYIKEKTTKPEAKQRLLRSRFPVYAEFNEAQLQAFEKMILPAFKEALGDAPFMYQVPEGVAPYVEPQVALKKVGSHWRETPAYFKVSQALRDLRVIYAFLEAAGGKLSPAARASKLQETLKELRRDSSWAKNPPRDPEALLKDFLKQWKKVGPLMKGPQGQKINHLVSSPMFANLTKSWGWIVQEAARTAKGIVKQNGFELPKFSAKDTYGLPTVDRMKLAEAFKRKLKGWKLTKTETIYRNEPEVCLTSPDDLTRFSFSENTYSVVPSFRMDEGSPWRSWSRMGVDSGAVNFTKSETIEGAIEKLITRVSEARAKQEVLVRKGENYSLGPVSIRQTPEGFSNFVEGLKSGRVKEVSKSGTLGVSGFGTYYQFSTTRIPGSKPASQELSDSVGKPVYWTTVDMD